MIWQPSKNPGSPCPPSPFSQTTRRTGVPRRSPPPPIHSRSKSHRPSTSHRPMPQSLQSLHNSRSNLLSRCPHRYDSCLAEFIRPAVSSPRRTIPARLLAKFAKFAPPVVKPPRASIASIAKTSRPTSRPPHSETATSPAPPFRQYRQNPSPPHAHQLQKPPSPSPSPSPTPLPSVICDFRYSAPPDEDLPPESGCHPSPAATPPATRHSSRLHSPPSLLPIAA